MWREVGGEGVFFREMRVERKGRKDGGKERGRKWREGRKEGWREVREKKAIRRNGVRGKEVWKGGGGAEKVIRRMLNPHRYSM